MQSVTRSICLISSTLRSIRSISRCTCSYSQSLVERVSPKINQQRAYSTDVLEAPIPEGVDKSYSPKIQQIVQDISQLTLLEVSDLNDLLKKTLNITDAPMMAMSASSAAAPAAPAEEAEEEKPQQALFTVKLTKFDTGKKVALIKAIKSLIAGMNLVQAKKFVEASPQDVKTDVSKEEAETLKKAIEEAGGTVELA